MHHVMKTTRTRRVSPLGIYVHHADGSVAHELDGVSRAFTLGCGVTSQSLETPATVATVQIEIEDVEDISTSSMLPEKLFHLFGCSA